MKKEYTTMITVAPISKSNHKDRFWQRFTSYRFAQDDYLAPLAAAEIAKAVHAMPMAFVRQKDRFVLVGLLSLTPGKNRFVDAAGKWVGQYVPSCFRGYPFGLAQMADKDGLILCIDESSGLISDTSGEPFFDGQGNLAKPVNDILTFLSRVRENREMTDSAVAALADAGMITPWPADAQDGLTHHVEGLHKVDEAKLNALNDDAFLALRRARSLPVAYAQLMSMENVGLLARLPVNGGPDGRTSGAQVKGMFLDDDMIRFE